MHLKWYVDIILMVTAFFAAAIDTLAGGGGLITVPALLISGLTPLFSIGTVKFQGAISELSATLYFMQKAKVNYRKLFWLFVYTIISSLLGVICLGYLPILILEKLIPFLLLAVFIYYLFVIRVKHSGLENNLKPSQKKFLLIGIPIGFYNGFFGPGTGSIWAVALMKVFKIDIQKATIYAKPLNFVGNVMALGVFMLNRDVSYTTAILMSMGSFLGGRFGAKFVMYKNVRILKITFLIIMSCSVVATFIKYYYIL